ncbi:aldehyde dehydrogenase family protein [Georgenia sp. Z1344]|uniref:aldehyde dehydrogenase family protein n=1 Tax=Georgenia sp. Z1344 TaxID=3416706 RepID=UPI003CFA35F1
MTIIGAPALTITDLTAQFIGGRWREGSSGTELLNTDPFSGEVLASYPAASLDDLDAAYRAADEARRGWREMNAYERRAIFENAVTYVESHRDEIVTMIRQEVGGTALKANFEIGLVTDILKEAATFPLRMEGKIMPSPIPDRENYLFREPLGVVGVISPFNFPFFLSMKPVATALGAGNAVVLKPHEDTLVTGGTLLAKIFEEAGLPAGVLNVVVTDISTIGDGFVEHPVPRAIVFTGSNAVGAHVAEVAGRNLKKVLLELGGNNAFIVLDDADLDLAVDAAVFSRFTHQGQICMSANRVLVQKGIRPAFEEKYVAKVESLTVGDPGAQDTIIGPVINERQATNLGGLVQRALDAGARPLVKGEVDGTLVHPTVLTDVTRDMEVARVEMFGPVVVLEEFDADEDAVRIANDSDFGLSGAVHTTDIERGMRIARNVETGMIHINDASIHDEPIIAFGGSKQSGFGRLNGQWSLDEFTEMKWISVNRGRRRFPY